MRIRYNTYNNKNHLFYKNRQINDNLEQQTQALFKSWFVDNPKPNWSETTFSEVANFIGGYSYKGEELTDSSNIAMVTMDVMADLRQMALRALPRL